MNNKIDQPTHIGEEYGIYTITELMPYKDKYNHYIYKGVCKECGFSRESTIDGFKRKVVQSCTHINKLTQEQLETWYEKNKKRCLFCGEFIPLSNNNFKEYKERKFCSRSCSTSYNNKGVNRYINKPKKNKSQNIQKSISKLDSPQMQQKNTKKNKQSRKCKLCGGYISKQNKSGYCPTCRKKVEDENKIKKWKETGETGCAVGAMIRNCIRKYIYQKQDGKCAICGIHDTWNSKSLHFILDHIDGDASNNWENNLRLICPNCDSQLDTYKSRNKNSARTNRKKYT